VLGPPLYIVLDGAAQARGLGCTANLPMHRAPPWLRLVCASSGGAARRLKVKERGAGCDAFCSTQVSEGARYRYSFQLLIEIGSMPKVIEFVLHAPTDVLCSCSQFAEAFNIGASLGERQAQYAVHGPVIHAD
jgi:hypothetical protein